MRFLFVQAKGLNTPGQLGFLFSERLQSSSLIRLPRAVNGNHSGCFIDPSTAAHAVLGYVHSR